MKRLHDNGSIKVVLGDRCSVTLMYVTVKQFLKPTLMTSSSSIFFVCVLILKIVIEHETMMGKTFYV